MDEDEETQMGAESELISPFMIFKGRFENVEEL